MPDLTPKQTDVLAAANSICAHAGEFCDGERHCDTCQKLLVSGYVYGDQHYCDEHKPASWDVEIAEMSEEEFDNQDDMYWTQWELDDIVCDCRADCACRHATLWEVEWPIEG
jgi:hypothetical protein